MKVLNVFCCILQVVGCVLHEEGGVVCESLGLGFIEGVYYSSDVLAAGDLDEEDFDHDNEEVGGDDIALWHSLLKEDGVGEVATNENLGGAVVQEKFDP